MHSDNAPSNHAAAEPVRTHQDVLTLIADVERQVARLRDVQALNVDEIARQDARLRELEAREQRLQTAEACCAAQLAEIDGRERACAERGEAIERERAMVAEERQRVARDVARLAEEMQSLAEVRDEVARRESALQAEAMRERESLDAMRQRLEALEREKADRMASAESLAAEVERLKAGAGALEARAERAESEARSLASEVHRARESETTHVRTLEARLAECTAELDATRQSLQLAGQKLAALAQSVADQAPQLERGAAALATVHEQERRLRELQQRLESTAGQVDRVAMLEANLETATRRSDVLAATVTGLERELKSARESLEISESNARALDAKLTEVSSAAGAAQSVQSAQAEAFARQLEEKARRIAEMGMLLRTRKERLDRARTLVRERAASAGRRAREVSEAALVNTLEEERLIKRQREDLRQVQEMLAASEARLMRRAARARGLTAAAWCMCATSAVGIACWVVAGLAWQPPAVASVDLVAKLPDGATLRPEVDAEWQSVHRDALKDAAFRGIVRRRLEERGVAALGGEKDIAAWFDDVHVDSDGPGSLRLIAQAPDSETAIVALDTLATSLANESAKLVKTREDLPRATLAGNTAVPGRVTFSSVIPQSSSMDQLTAAGMLFSGVAGIGLATGLVVFGRLSRAKRSFEELGGV